MATAPWRMLSKQVREETAAPAARAAGAPGSTRQFGWSTCVPQEPGWDTKLRHRPQRIPGVIWVIPLSLRGTHVTPAPFAAVPAANGCTRGVELACRPWHKDCCPIVSPQPLANERPCTQYPLTVSLCHS
jgi:hypothetical protein